MQSPITSAPSTSSPFPRVDTTSILQPPRQRRARETEQALLAAGRKLLAERDFAAVSVAQISAACQVSVGAFYGRFRDKMAFFDALRTLVMEESDASVARYMAEHRWGEVPARQIVEKTMRFLVNGCHNNRGVIRASLKHSSTRPEEWLPHQKNGEEIVERLVALLTPGCRARPKPTKSACVSPCRWCSACWSMPCSTIRARSGSTTSACPAR